ncbi:hypothetical protein GF378_02900 [Candidatus Pacearchaeota archaeon]|nr:hypothetical protein [Candidatus Pacearchaeota archaeon]
MTIKNSTDHIEEYHSIRDRNSEGYETSFPEADEIEEYEDSMPEQKHHDLLKRYFFSKEYNDALKAREQHRNNKKRMSKDSGRPASNESQLIKKAENLAEKEEEIYNYLKTQGEPIFSYEDIKREDFYASIRNAEDYFIFRMPAENHVAKGPGFVEIFTDYIDFNNKYGKQEIKEGKSIESIHLNEEEHFNTLGVFHLNDDSELISRFKQFLASSQHSKE